MPTARTDLRAILLRIQHELFVAQSQLAAPNDSPKTGHRIEPRHVQRMEADIESLGATFASRDALALPRGTRAAAELHVSRTVCRRAERELWTLHASEPVPEPLLQWTNRLSSLLFAMALSVNRSEGVAEIAPDYSV